MTTKAKRPSKKLKVMLVAAEASPYAVTGGLGDVVSALASTLHTMNCDVRLVVPYYRHIREMRPSKVKTTGKFLPVSFNGAPLPAEVLTDTHPDGFPVYFIRQDKYYDRAALYGTEEGDYRDNGYRFLYFSQCVFPLCEALKFKPDIIHCHDWQAAPVPIYLKHVYKKTPFFRDTASVLTIHNLAYQGLFPADIFPATGLPPELFSVHGLEFWGKVNFMKGGLYAADLLNTVSPSYRDEVLQEENGCGLSGVLTDRQNDFFGILNGANYQEWSPACDPYIPTNYSAKNLENKSISKKALLKKFGINRNLHNLPLFGMVSRFTEQKGLDIIASAVEELIDQKAVFLMVGTGEGRYHTQMHELALKFSGKMGLKIGFDTPLAHLMKAGCDLFVIPSRYEPCGLSQFYSMKYGTIPVVRATGGLRDSVLDYDANKQRGTGFKFNDYSPSDFLKSTSRAIEIFHDPKAWTKLQKNCMSQDFSWKVAAKKYLKLYQDAQHKVKADGGDL